MFSHFRTSEDQDSDIDIEICNYLWFRSKIIKSLPLNYFVREMHYKTHSGWWMTLLVHNEWVWVSPKYPGDRISKRNLFHLTIVWSFLLNKVLVYSRENEAIIYLIEPLKLAKWTGGLQDVAQKAQKLRVIIIFRTTSLNTKIHYFYETRWQ